MKVEGVVELRLYDVNQNYSGCVGGRIGRMVAITHCFAFCEGVVEALHVLAEAVRLPVTGDYGPDRRLEVID